jgi:hypothetical protein
MITLLWLSHGGRYPNWACSVLARNTLAGLKLCSVKVVKTTKMEAFLLQSDVFSCSVGRSGSELARYDKTEHVLSKLELMELQWHSIGSM